MKIKTLLFTFFAIVVSLSLVSQTQITDKGYFYSPNGFVCKNGNIYTKDLKTLVRAQCYTDNEGTDDPYSEFSYLIEIPSGAEVIPSNVMYAPEGKQYATGYSRRYAIVIPSSVKYIATDAFMHPFVYFFSGESSVNAINEVAFDINATEVARFNINGQPIKGKQEGINIVLMSDGTARKIMVK